MNYEIHKLLLKLEMGGDKILSDACPPKTRSINPVLASADL